jgi:hypothetical protein
VFCKVDGDGRLLEPQGTANWNSITDGLSNTILFAERYARCRNAYFQEGGSLWAYDKADATAEPLHAGFAISWTTFSIGPASMFQSMPRPDNCDPTLAATPHRAMQVVLADVSVRTLSPSLTGASWWAACTPNKNDRPGPDW